MHLSEELLGHHLLSSGACLGEWVGNIRGIAVVSSCGVVVELSPELWVQVEKLFSGVNGAVIALIELSVFELGEVVEQVVNIADHPAVTLRDLVGVGLEVLEGVLVDGRCDEVRAVGVGNRSM